MSSNLVKSGNYDHNIQLLYNITTYTTIFSLIIKFLVDRCM